MSSPEVCTPGDIGFVLLTAVLAERGQEVPPEEVDERSEDCPIDKDVSHAVSFRDRMASSC